MNDLLVRNVSVIATLDAEGRILRDTDIHIRGNRIYRMGAGLEAEGAEVVDGRGRIALPGLVNTHHHLYQSLTRCIPLVQDEELFGWLTSLYHIWRELTPEAVYAGTLLGLAELLLTGCTTATDMFYVFPKGTPADLFDQQVRAAQELGIRFQPTRGSMSRGQSEGGLPPDDIVQSEDVIMADCERVIQRFHDSDPLGMIKIALAPCSPFSVTPQLLRDTAQMARQHGVRLHTHLAETKDEETYCIEIYNKRPFEFMEEVGWIGSDVWYAHAIHLSEREVQRMGETGTGVAHCPTSNFRLGSGIAPIPEMLAARVPVGLGVDGSASNDSGNMLGEVRMCMLAHRVRTGTRSMTAERALRLATQGGARVLGYNELGVLAEGKGADLIMLDLGSLGLAGGAVHDAVASVLFCGFDHRVDTSIVNGRVVVQKGRLVGTAEARVAELANQIARDMVDKAHKRTGIDFLRKWTGA